MAQAYAIGDTVEIIGFTDDTVEWYKQYLGHSALIVDITPDYDGDDFKLTLPPKSGGNTSTGWRASEFKLIRTSDNNERRQDMSLVRESIEQALTDDDRLLLTLGITNNDGTLSGAGRDLVTQVLFALNKDAIVIEAKKIAEGREDAKAVKAGTDLPL